MVLNLFPKRYFPKIWLKKYKEAIRSYLRIAKWLPGECQLPSKTTKQSESGRKNSYTKVLLLRLSSKVIEPKSLDIPGFNFK